MAYKTIYKCRLCGKKFTPPNGYFADDMTNDARIQFFLGTMCQQNRGNNLPYEHHICDNGDIGFADLLGVRKVNE